MTNALRTSMERDGFVLVPNVLSAREVGRLRTAVTRFCDANRGTYYENESKANLNVFAPEPEDLHMLFALPALAQVMKEVVGPDVRFLRELGVGIGGSSGWHKDTHGLARSLRGEHDAYGVYKLLIYPQDHLGLDEDDFALKVRKRSHWIPEPTVGEVETLHIRAGDLIIIDCRTSHRGRNSTTENASLLTRALYFPFNRGTPRLTFEVRRKIWRILGKQERQIIAAVYGRPNAFTDEYMQRGRSLAKQRFEGLDVDRPLPASWRRALDDVQIGY